MIHENFTWPKYDQQYLNPVTVPNNPYRDPNDEQADLDKEWMVQFMEERVDSEMQNTAKDHVLAHGEEDLFGNFSAYSLDRHDVPINNIMEPVHSREFRLKETGLKRYPPTTTWLDLMLVLNRHIVKTGDFHHRFLEGIEPEKCDVDGVEIFSLVLGS